MDREQKRKVIITKIRKNHSQERKISMFKVIKSHYHRLAIKLEKKIGNTIPSRENTIFQSFITGFKLTINIYP